jgi:hypothetical protein
MMGPENARESGREDEPCGDLGLTAFRYIAAEMSADEAEAFERRLSRDHSAREAVAEVVQVSELASAALAPCPVVAPAAGMRSHWMAPLAWMAAGAAACLALVAALYGVVDTSEDRPLAKAVAPPIVAPQAVVAPTFDHAALVRRTAELRDEGLEVWQSGADPLVDDASLALADIQQLDVETTVPDWLLAAVSVEFSGDCTEVQEN